MAALEEQPPITETEPDNKIITTDSSKSSLELSFSTPNCNSSSITIETDILPHEEEHDRLDIIESCESSKITEKNSHDGGSDSGVEIGATAPNIGILQRALSSNSGGYASSSCGLEEQPGNASCNSSMISFCSDLCESKTSNTVLRHNSNHDCTSEGGSESSSITGGPSSARRISIQKKKVALTEPFVTKSPKRDDNSVAKSRSRAASANRAAAHSKTTPGPPILATRERARSRDKILSNDSSSIKPLRPQNRSTPIKRPPKPDYLPTGNKDPTSPAIQRVLGTRTPSVTRGRTPGSTPTVEDGRWPSIGARTLSAKTNGSSTPENLIIKTKIGPLSLDFKSSSLDKYATLPRRRKEKSDEDFLSRNYRSNSAQRDRMTSSMTKKQNSKDSPFKDNSINKNRKLTQKIKIYHETSVQTAITSKDIEDAFSGAAKNIQVEAVETCDTEIQVDIRDKEIERLEEQLKKITSDYTILQGALSERSQMLLNTEKQLHLEREEKQAMHIELQSNTERVLGMLELVNVQPPDEDNCDSLLMLESQIQQSGHILEQKQSEIDKLHSLCKKLQMEMQRSMNVQRNLIEEKEVFEKESTELQDFLQDEKTALMDALREAEAEMDRDKQMFMQKQTDIERLQEECRHLVRISEQRRQEYLGMQSKYSALESRSKELIIQQSSAVSGASMALAGLGARLDSLVGQLISSYNISEQELEDVIFHNEAYTNSGSSGDNSPEFETDGHTKIFTDPSLSPQRHQSFIVAVINAIKSAASTAKQTVHKKELGNITGNANDEESDSTEMLDSETEPCLMMENVLEDVSMPDSHSHNMVSSTGMILSQIEIPSDMDREEESIHNLSQAIAHRQQIELQTSRIMKHNSEQSISDELSAHESIAEIPSISEYCSAQALVDQVIEVDNLVTKLLKVLRIIQMDNDNCIQQLIGEKNKLQLNKEEMLEKLKEREILNLKLKRELEDASHELIVNSSDLANSKIELQRHRTEIDRLNMDICNLSTLCSQNNAKYFNKDDILNALKMLQDNKGNPDPEIVSQIVAASQEIPMIKEKILSKERQLNDLTNNQTRPMLLNNWQKALSESKRQYEAIDRALETLSSNQTIVQQCPALEALQRDLEETNFQSASTIPVYTALLSATTNNGHNTSDYNANASSNGVQLKNGDSPGKNTIDSTA